MWRQTVTLFRNRQQILWQLSLHCSSTWNVFTLLQSHRADQYQRAWNCTGLAFNSVYTTWLGSDQLVLQPQGQPGPLPTGSLATLDHDLKVASKLRFLPLFCNAATFVNCITFLDSPEAQAYIPYSFRKCCWVNQHCFWFVLIIFLSEIVSMDGPNIYNLKSQIKWCWTVCSFLTAVNDVF